jgi:integrase
METAVLVMPKPQGIEKPERNERGTGRIYQFGVPKGEEQKGRIWWIQYYDASGRQRRESSHSKTRRVAEKLLQRRLVEKEKGELPTFQSRRLTYDDLRDAYYAEYQMLKRKSLRFDKDGKPRLDKIVRLDDFFSGYRVSEVTSDALRKFTIQLQEKGKKDSTINRSLAALKHMFRMARKDGKIHEIPNFTMLKEPPPRQGTLAHEKYADLLKSLPEYLQTFLAIGYHTGMRRSEVKNLKWSDVNLAERIVRLNAGQTKNNEAREIPISGQLYEILSEQFQKRDLRTPFVCFRISKSGKVLQIGDFRKAWDNRCAKLGLDLHYHDLRRTFITDAEYAGTPRHEVMKITGHLTESAYKRYAIEQPAGKRAVVDKMSAWRAEQNGANSGQVGANAESSQEVNI